MEPRDQRGLQISGSTPDARDHFERALAAHLGWRTGVEQHLQRSIAAAPAFTMAHVLSAHAGVCSRDPALVRQARRAYAIAAGLPATPREQLHVAAIGAILADDFPRLKGILQALLAVYPRDVLALQVGHSFDYLTGDLEGMRDRVAAVLPAWSPGLPGYHAVLAMQAFGLAENGEFSEAADTGLRALELAPWDARAHHALTHVHEMSGDAAGGMRWMQERLASWANGTVATTHLWWHWALFHLAQGEVHAALEIYDRHVRGSRSAAVADLIDASALLWRIELSDGKPGERWAELAADWAGHLEDAYCSFSDMHAMLAYVGARDWVGAARIEGHLVKAQADRTRYGATTRLVALPACRAFVAFGRGEYARAIQLLGMLPADAHRIGGSHAQRDILFLTLFEAAARLRRSARAVAA